MKTPLTARTLKEHFAYSWWKYLLIALVAFGLVDLLYTLTAYRIPADKEVAFYVYGAADQDKLNEYMDNVRRSEMEDMESLSSLILMDDSYYGPMQLMTYMAAGEGDIYLLPRDQFISSATSGALLPLENDAELMALFNDAGISLQSGWRKDAETGETHLCGIPQNKLPGLSRYAYVQDGYLCAVVTGGNDVNALKFLRILCRDMLREEAVTP